MGSRGNAIGIFVVIAAIAIFFGVYNYYMDSPAHVLSMVRGAVITHDREIFDKYVDAEAIAEENCQVLTEVLLERDEAAGHYGREYLKKLAEENEPQAKKILKKQLYQIVDGKTALPPEKNIGIEDYPQFFEKSSSNLLKKLRLDSFEYMGVDTAIVKDSTAVVDVSFYDKRLNKHYSLKLNMEKIDEGWKVRELINLKEFLFSINRDIKDVLKEKNKPLKDEINQYARIHDVKARGIDNRDLSTDTVMKVDVPIFIGRGKSISCIKGRVYVEDQGHQRYRVPFEIYPETSYGEMVYTVEKPLGSFVRDSETIARLSRGKLKFGAVIRQVEFTDGTSIKLLTGADLGAGK